MLYVNSTVENEESQPHNKRDRLTTLRVSSEAENGEPQLHNKRGINSLTFGRRVLCNG
jgi:hypothetical protein